MASSVTTGVVLAAVGKSESTSYSLAAVAVMGELPKVEIGETVDRVRWGGGH